MIFIGITMVNKYKHSDNINQIGFVIANVIQLIIVS